MEIKVLTEGIEYNREGTTHFIDFGNIPLNSDATVELQVSGNKIKNFVPKSHCSCTSTNPNRVDENTLTLSLKYKNTHLKEPFTKTVTVNFIENGTKKREEIKLKGTVR